MFKWSVECATGLFAQCPSEARKGLFDRKGEVISRLPECGLGRAPTCGVAVMPDMHASEGTCALGKSMPASCASRRCNPSNPPFDSACARDTQRLCARQPSSEHESSDGRILCTCLCHSWRCGTAQVYSRSHRATRHAQACAPCCLWMCSVIARYSYSPHCRMVCDKGGIAMCAYRYLLSKPAVT
jgi:hypothetical protein